MMIEMIKQVMNIFALCFFIHSKQHIFCTVLYPWYPLALYAAQQQVDNKYIRGERRYPSMGVDCM